LKETGEKCGFWFCIAIIFFYRFCYEKICKNLYQLVWKRERKYPRVEIQDKQQTVIDFFLLFCKKWV
jgi:hypothetical protein